MATLTSPLNRYAILSGTGITGTINFKNRGDGTAIYIGNNTNVTNTISISTTTGTTVGPNNTLASDAQTKLTTLKNAILALSTTTAGIGTTVSSAVTYVPGRTSYSSALTFQTAPITFDAGGDPNAKFYITAGTAITFTTGSITLINRAKSSNIYWVTGSAGISVAQGFTGDLYGNFISATAITLQGNTVNGFLFAQSAAVTFAASAIVNSIPLVVDEAGELVEESKESNIWLWIIIGALILIFLLLLLATKKSKY